MDWLTHTNGLAMDLLHPRVAEYLRELSSHDDPVLRALEEEARRTKFPIIGPVMGRVCYQIARMIGARRVFELGSGFGYSTIWFAKAVRDNGGGEVFHVVWDAKLSQRARQAVADAGLTEIVRFEVGEAVATLRRTAGPFDLIFNDIDKEGYPASLPAIKEKLQLGGVLIVDNMLWHGAIFDDADQSPETRGVREFTRAIRGDRDFHVTLNPIRDGFIVALQLGGG